MRGRTIEGEARLDNRVELFAALGIDRAEQQGVGDLELALRAHDRWGDTSADKLLGDFAFVVRDASSGSVFGARDPLGVKPFYYRASERGLAFATRAKAVAAVDGLPLELDEARIADTLVPELECLDHTATFFRGVSRLPPGHRLIAAGGRAIAAPYWRPDPSREIRLAGDREYVEAFREVFTEAVRCRLSDSTASMLSGGLDSSTIVGFARRVLEPLGNPRLLTLSGITDDPGCEESHHIRVVAGLPGLHPITVRPCDIEEYRTEIEAFLDSIDEPFDGTMMLPLLLYAAAHRQGVRVVLDGVDGDVVASHEPDVLVGLLQRGAWWEAIRQARGFGWFYQGSYEPWSSAARLLATSAGRAFTPAALRALWRPIRDARALREALEGSVLSRDFAHRIDLGGRLRRFWAHRHPSRAGLAREIQARELSHPQIAAAAERYHRVAASCWIEVRHPFLDRRVVEFCLALPRRQKVDRGWSKLIVRRAAEGYLPDSVRWRRDRWVRLGPKFLGAAVACCGDFLAREISDAESPLAAYIDIERVRKLHDRYRRGDTEPVETLWTTAILASWLRRIGLARYDAGALANGPAAPSRLPLAG